MSMIIEATAYKGTGNVVKKDMHISWNQHLENTLYGLQNKEISQ